MEFDLSFAEPSVREQGVFIEMLALSKAEEPLLQLHVRFTYDHDSQRMRAKCWGGENEGQMIPQEVLELLYCVHLGALRDAERDVSPGRGNRLSRLLMKLVPEEAKQKEYAKKANLQMRSVPEWTKLLERAGKKINEHLKAVALRNTLQEVAIDFVEAEFRRIAESLKVQVPIADPARTTQGDETPNTRSAAFAIRQNGLGLNNLIYASTVLGDLRERRKRGPDSYIALLIEEPEAHLHPHLQNVFFRYLKSIEKDDIQVFLTSHSPTITATTDLDSLIVLTRRDESISSQPLTKVDLEERQRAYLERFLDVTKSQLFFAKGVVLVEGISEALLLPSFAKRLGREFDLEHNGIEVVNVGGVAFEPFARLFNSPDASRRLGIRCAIITDDDRGTCEGSAADQVSSRAERAVALEDAFVKTYLAKRTFEYELYVSNESLVLDVYSSLHPKTDLQFHGSIEERAVLFVEKIKNNRDKAEFAQDLARTLEAPESLALLTVPGYIAQAIKWLVDKNDETTH